VAVPPSPACYVRTASSPGDGDAPLDMSHPADSVLLYRHFDHFDADDRTEEG
jgi:hypothetical protein